MVRVLRRCERSFLDFPMPPSPSSTTTPTNQPTNQPINQSTSDDLYAFGDRSVKPNSGTFYLRQVVSSSNFRTVRGGVGVDDIDSGGRNGGGLVRRARRGWKTFACDANDFLHGWLNYGIEHHVSPSEGSNGPTFDSQPSTLTTHPCIYQSPLAIHLTRSCLLKTKRKLLACFFLSFFAAVPEPFCAVGAAVPRGRQGVLRGTWGAVRAAGRVAAPAKDRGRHGRRRQHAPVPRGVGTAGGPHGLVRPEGAAAEGKGGCCGRGGSSSCCCCCFCSFRGGFVVGPVVGVLYSAEGSVPPPANISSKELRTQNYYQNRMIHGCSK